MTREASLVALLIIIMCMIIVLSNIHDEQSLDREISLERYEEVWNGLMCGSVDEVLIAMQDGKITYREFLKIKQVHRKSAKKNLKEWKEMMNNPPEEFKVIPKRPAGFIL